MRTLLSLAAAAAAFVLPLAASASAWEPVPPTSSFWYEGTAAEWVDGYEVETGYDIVLTDPADRDPSFVACVHVGGGFYELHKVEPAPPSRWWRDTLWLLDRTSCSGVTPGTGS